MIRIELYFREFLDGGIERLKETRWTGPSSQLSPFARPSKTTFRPILRPRCGKRRGVSKNSPVSVENVARFMSFSSQSDHPEF